MAGNTLSILHWEHMGVGVVLSHALNQIGVKSRVVSRVPHPFGFKADYIIPYRRILNEKNDWFSIKRNRLSKSTIFHNHSNYKVSKKLSKHWKGRFIQHYHDPNTKKPIYNVPSFVSIPALLDIIPDSTWIPFPVDADQFTEPFVRLRNDKLTVGFCAQEIDPTKKALIPHRELTKIAEEDKGIDLHPLKKIIPHNQMHKYYSKLDVWVDRIIDDNEKGFYGFAASECAMMGIPIITKIDEQTLTYIDSCPFINISDRSKLATELKSLAEDEEQRRNLSRITRDYAIGGEGYPTEVLGIRPGEKINEVLINEEEISRIREQEELYIIAQHNPHTPLTQEYTSTTTKQLTIAEIKNLLRRS